jgi:hypothetical protein
MGWKPLVRLNYPHGREVEDLSRNASVRGSNPRGGSMKNACSAATIGIPISDRIAGKWPFSPEGQPGMHPVSGLCGASDPHFVRKSDLGPAHRVGGGPNMRGEVIEVD